jgi:hypothetical protein
VAGSTKYGHVHLRFIKVRELPDQLYDYQFLQKDAVAPSSWLSVLHNRRDVKHMTYISNMLSSYWQGKNNGPVCTELRQLACRFLCRNTKRCRCGMQAVRHWEVASTAPPIVRRSSSSQECCCTPPRCRAQLHLTERNHVPGSAHTTGHLRCHCLALLRLRSSL